MQLHYITRDSKGNEVETGVLTPGVKWTRFEMFHDCHPRFGACIGSVKEEDKTVAWLFSRCASRNKSCQVYVTTVELVD